MIDGEVVFAKNYAVLLQDEIHAPRIIILKIINTTKIQREVAAEEAV